MGAIFVIIAFLIFALIELQFFPKKCLNFIVLTMFFSAPASILLTFSALWQTSTGLPNDVSAAESSDFVEERAKEIRLKINSMTDEIESEKDKIDNALHALVKNVEEKSNEVLVLQNEHTKLLEDIEFYKSLSSLSEEQTKAVVENLNKGKHKDRAFGFVLGVISSLLATFITHVYNSRKLKE